MKDTGNKCVAQVVPASSDAALAGDVQVWYQHNLGEDITFYKDAANAESAKKQAGVIFDLMRFLEEKKLIEEFFDSNTGGFNTLDGDGKRIKTVVRDESTYKEQFEVVAKEGDLRLWYMQMFGSREIFYARASNADDEAMDRLLTTHEFYANASNADEAINQLLTIYELTLFLYNHNQIPDYCNAGGVEVYEADGDGGFEWCLWCSDDGLDAGEIISMYMEGDDTDD